MQQTLDFNFVCSGGGLTPTAPNISERVKFFASRHEVVIKRMTMANIIKKNIP